MAVINPTPTSQTPQPNFTNSSNLQPAGQQTVNYPSWRSGVALAVANALVKGYGLPNTFDVSQFGDPRLSITSGNGTNGGTTNGTGLSGPAFAMVESWLDSGAWRNNPDDSSWVTSILGQPPAPSPNDYVLDPTADAKRISDEQWQASYNLNVRQEDFKESSYAINVALSNAAQNASVRSSSTGSRASSSGGGSSAAVDPGITAYQSAQLAYQNAQLALQGELGRGQLALDTVKEAAQEAYQNAQLDISRQQMAQQNSQFEETRADQAAKDQRQQALDLYNAQTQRGQTIAQVMANPADSVQEEYMLEQGKSPLGTAYDIFTGKQQPGQTDLPTVMAQNAQNSGISAAAGAPGAQPAPAPTQAPTQAPAPAAAPSNPAASAPPLGTPPPDVPAVVPAAATGGTVNDPVAIVGEGQHGNRLGPDAEMVVNPTHAPIQVIPHDQLPPVTKAGPGRFLLRGFASGTGGFTYNPNSSASAADQQAVYDYNQSQIPKAVTLGQGAPTTGSNPYFLGGVDPWAGMRDANGTFIGDQSSPSAYAASMQAAPVFDIYGARAKPTGIVTTGDAATDAAHGGGMLTYDQNDPHNLSGAALLNWMKNNPQQSKYPDMPGYVAPMGGAPVGGGPVGSGNGPGETPTPYGGPGGTDQINNGKPVPESTNPAGNTVSSTPLTKATPPAGQVSLSTANEHGYQTVNSGGVAHNEQFPEATVTLIGDGWETKGPDGNYYRWDQSSQQYLVIPWKVTDPANPASKTAGVIGTMDEWNALPQGTRLEILSGRPTPYVVTPDIAQSVRAGYASTDPSPVGNNPLSQDEFNALTDQQKYDLIMGNPVAGVPDSRRVTPLGVLGQGSTIQPGGPATRWGGEQATGMYTTPEGVQVGGQQNYNAYDAKGNLIQGGGAGLYDNYLSDQQWTDLQNRLNPPPPPPPPPPGPMDLLPKVADLPVQPGETPDQLKLRQNAAAQGEAGDWVQVDGVYKFAPSQVTSQNPNVVNAGTPRQPLGSMWDNFRPGFGGGNTPPPAPAPAPPPLDPLHPLSAPATVSQGETKDQITQRLQKLSLGYKGQWILEGNQYMFVPSAAPAAPTVAPLPAGSTMAQLKAAQGSAQGSWSLTNGQYVFTPATNTPQAQPVTPPAQEVPPPVDTITQPDPAQPAGGGTTPPPAGTGNVTPPATLPPALQGMGLSPGDLLTYLTGDSGISALTYSKDTYQNAPGMQAIDGRSDLSDYMSLGNQPTTIPGLDGVVLPPPNDMNIQNLMWMKQNAPSQYAFWSSVWKAGNRNLDNEVNRLMQRAPLGSAYQPTLIRS